MHYGDVEMVVLINRKEKQKKKEKKEGLFK